jgi:anti-sigma regulatory factor (Ser/Thr protein kinase)
LNVRLYAFDAGLICTLSIRADASEVRRASNWLETSGRSLGIPSDQIARLDICLHETLANVIAHGGLTSRSSPIFIRLAFHPEPDAPTAILCVSDSGMPFDPTAMTRTPGARTLSEAVPGGLGLVMIRSNADDWRYHLAHGQNQNKFNVCRDKVAA